MKYLQWNGEFEKYIDSISIREIEDIWIGNFGGSSSKGTVKNEDGAIIYRLQNHGVLAIIFDAHTSTDSVLELQRLVLELNDEIYRIGSIKDYSSLGEIKKLIEGIINSSRSNELMKNCTGETAVLFTYQYEEYVWWLSIGDNQLYIFHEEFNSLGQYNVNSRIFYQWIGKMNSVNLKVPCYTTGTLELREGSSRIIMLTDGILEIDKRPFENADLLKKYICEDVLESGLMNTLELVKKSEGKDNATIIGWDYTSVEKALRPSR